MQAFCNVICCLTCDLLLHLHRPFLPRSCRWRAGATPRPDRTINVVSSERTHRGSPLPQPQKRKLLAHSRHGEAGPRVQPEEDAEEDDGDEEHDSAMA